MIKNIPYHEQEAMISITSRDLKSMNGLVEPVHFSNDEEEQASADRGVVIMKIGNRLTFNPIIRAPPIITPHPNP